jgi:DNA-binding GntR family transcriptional regulator
MPTPHARVRRPNKAPRYVQLAEELRGQILTRRTHPGEPFPTEAELCRTYDVSRFTVREALRRLEQEGLIARRRGSGTTLQPAAARGGALHQPLSNVSEILQYARGTEIRYEHLPPGPVPARYAEQLAEDVTGNWLRLKGVRRDLNGKTLALTEVFVAERLEQAVAHLDPKRFTLFRQLAEQGGLRITGITQEIQAVAASAAVSRELGVTPRAPCLRVLRCYFADDFLFEISASHHPGDRFAYSMHIDIDG